MILIVCIDDNKGMMFNHRRQSQDGVLRRHILDMVCLLYTSMFLINA